MNIKNTLPVALACITCCTAFSAHAASSTSPPLEYYARLPMARQVKLSPDGSLVAFFYTKQGVSSLAVLDPATNKLDVPIIDNMENQRLSWFEWVNNDTIVFSAAFSDIRYTSETTETRLHAINVRGKPKFRNLIRLKKRDAALMREGDYIPQLQDQVISWLPGDDQHLLISLDLQVPAVPAVYKLDVNSRKREKIQSPWTNVVGWIADRNGENFIAVERDKTRISYLAQDKKSGQWKPVFQFEKFVDPDIQILGFGENNTVYFTRLHNERYALFRMQLDANPRTEELVLADERYDFDGQLIVSPATGRVIGVYYDSGDASAVYFDKEYDDFQKSIDKALPQAVNVLTSLSSNERRYVLLSSDDNDPGTYYLGDRDKGTLAPLVNTYPELLKTGLAPTRKIRYTARDGVELEAYLTVPKTFDNKPLPTIVLPHGGPISKTDGSFDFIVEFLASRGYAVIQPNFRGSTGYGFAFEMAAIRQYGGKLQNDIEDAALWMVKEKIADKNRMCIVGGSFGGYAALYAAARHGKTYRCAVSIAGVSDLQSLVNYLRDFSSRDIARAQIGSDRKELAAQSPIRMIDDIHMPVLLIHGTRDTVVPFRQSVVMADALKGAKKPHEYVELENGNHHMTEQSHRVQLLQALESFLAKNI